MMATDEIRRRIEEALPGAQVKVSDMTGGGDHFDVVVVADQFEGKLPIARHRMVYASLSDVLGGALHALALQTRTPAEAGA